MNSRTAPHSPVTAFRIDINDLRAWADAGMDYDSTLSYADRPGFRCGTCSEYPAFDPVAGEAPTARLAIGGHGMLSA